jgi:hypothetical protein
MATPVRRGRTRLLFAGLSALLMLMLSTQSTLAAVSWTSAVKSSPSYAYNYAQGLAKTTSTVSGTTYLHSQYTYVNTTHPGVYYRRDSAGASSWGTAKRINPSGEFGDSGAIAAADKYVYVAYNQLAAWDYNEDDPRQLHIRVNTNHGSSTAWLDVRLMSSGVLKTGRPAVAAAGTWGYVAYTDAETGAIRVARNGGMNVLDDTWLTTDIGSTANQAANPIDGADGYPVIAATGATVVVAWISGDGHTIVSKISTDRGETWPDTATTITTSQVWDLSAAATSGRLALAWAQPSGIKARLYRNAAWQPTKTVASFSSTATYKTGYGTSITMAGTARVGVAWSACTRSDCSAGSTKGVNIRWRESTDNLASWKSPALIASYTASTSRRINDYPTAIISSKPTRWIMYNVLSANQPTYSLVVEVGRGTP